MHDENCNTPLFFSVHVLNHGNTQSTLGAVYNHYFYRQLLCFERHIQTCFENVSTLDAVKDVFRAMMPIFNNHNKSVITPLLATGDQVSNLIHNLRRVCVALRGLKPAEHTD